MWCNVVQIVIAIIIIPTSCAFNFTKSPIIALGLPKTGTTSLQSFLNIFNHDKSIHAEHWASPINNLKIPIPEVVLANGVTWAEQTTQPVLSFLGLKIQQAIAEGEPPLKYVFQRGVNAAIQLDVMISETLSIWPQIHALDMILDAYPEAFYVHTTRRSKYLINSMNNFNAMGKRFHTCGELREYERLYPNNTNDQNLELFIEHAGRTVRQAFLKRPNYRYLEIDIESDPHAGAKLSIFLGGSRLEGMPHHNHHTG